MASDGTLIFDSKIDDSGFKKDASKMGKEGMQLGNKLSKGMSDLGGKVAKKTGQLIKTGIKATTVALTAFTAASIKVGSDFEAGMSQVAATMGMTQQEIQNGSREFEMLSASAREMGAATKFSATEAAEALNYIALAGIDADDAVKLLPKTLNLAAAGGLDLGYTTDLITDSMSALGLSIDEVDGFMDEMARTSQKSNTDIGQLGEAILTVGGTAKDLAGGTVELNTALGILANNGIKGSEGGTKLRNVIMSLTAPTDAAAKALNGLGVEVFDAEGNMRPLNETFQDLNLKMADMTVAEKKQWLSTVFNKQDLAAVSALLASTAVSVDDVALSMDLAGVNVDELGIDLMGLAGSMGEFSDKQDFVSHAMETWGLTTEQAGLLYDGLMSALGEGGNAWDELQDDIENSTGAAAEMSKVMMDNLKGDLTTMKSALEELSISFFETFDTNLRGAVQTATQTIDGLSMAFRGLDLSDMKSNLKEAGVDVDELGVSLVQASYSMEQFDNKADFVASAVEKWGISEEEASAIFDELSKSMEETGNKSELVAKVITESIHNMVEGLMEALPTLLEVGANIVKYLVQGIIDNVPLLITSAADLILSFAEGFDENSDQIISKGLEMVEALGVSIAEAAPKLAKAAALLVKGLVTGIIDNLPQIFNTAAKIIGELLAGIVENLPAILSTGIKIITSLGKGIVEAIPQILALIPNIIKQMVQIFSSHDWAINGKEMMTKLAKGIRSSVSEAISAAREIAQKIFDSIKQKVKDFFGLGQGMGDETSKGVKSKEGDNQKSGQNLGEKIKQGLESKKEAIKTAGGNIASGAAQFIGTKVGEFQAKGSELIQRMKAGMDSGKGAVQSAMSSILSGAKSTASGFVSSFKSIGSNIASGIANGISAGVGFIKNAVSGVMESARAKARALMDIHSPSRVMAKDVGQPITQGIAQGITDAEYTVVASMNQISDGILERMQRNNEKMDIFELRAMNERNKKLEELQLRHIDTAYQMYQELHKKSIEEVNAEIEKKQDEIEKAKEAKQSEAIQKSLEQEKTALEERKTYLEDYANKFTETYEGIVNEYENAAKKIESTSESIKEKLISYGDVIEQVRDAEGNVIKDEFGNDMLKLSDLDAQIQQVANYGNLLEQLEARGADVDVMSKFLSMSVDDAVKYGKLLMEQSDQDWDNYMRKMQTKRIMAEEISKKYYQGQLDTLNKEYTGKLTENLAEIVGSSEEIGKQSAEALAKGLIENSGTFERAVEDIISRANATLGEELNRISTEANKRVAASARDAEQRMQEINNSYNFYGADYSERQQTYDYANDMEREIRRRGLAW